MDADLLERAKAVVQAWQAGDLSPLKELLDPEVDLIWWEAGRWDCHNREDVLRLLERLRQSGLGGTEIELIDAGDDVLVTVTRPRPRLAESWPEETATVITFRDGKAIHLWQFKTPDQALAAARSPESTRAVPSPDERRAEGSVEYAVPILPSRNLDETLAFYERLGFRRSRAPGDTHPQLSIVRGGIELRFYHAPELNPFATAATCYLRVPHADQLHQEWELIGVPLDRGTGSRLLAPVETDDGSCEFTLIDKSGNILRIGSSPG